MRSTAPDVSWPRRRKRSEASGKEAGSLSSREARECTSGRPCGGLAPPRPPPRARARLPRRWEEEGPLALHGDLGKVDPESAARIHPSDRVRVVRALEVAELTGEPASARRTCWSAGGSRVGGLFLVLAVDRAELYRRVVLRGEAVVRAGLVEEVRELFAQGYGRGLQNRGGVGG